MYIDNEDLLSSEREIVYLMDVIKKFDLTSRLKGLYTDKKEEVSISVVIPIYKSSATLSELTAYFKGLFGERVDIKLNCIKEIKPEPSGKYRFSICRLPQCY